MTFRPARERIVSMFSDYWNNVNPNSSSKIDEIIKSLHLQRIQKRYFEQSHQYIKADGQIDSDAWFTSFANYGAGLPFMLSEIFDESPMHFRLALANREIELVETRQIDRWLSELCGLSTIERKRVSFKYRSPAVAEALQNSRLLIDQITERDWAYDQAAHEFLIQRQSGKPFRPWT